MISFANAIEIHEDAERVYAYLADLEHTPEWNWAIGSSEKISRGPVAVGTAFRLVRSSPRPATEILEITGLDPGRRVDVAGRLGPFTARLTYELAPSRSGTRLTNTVELEPSVPLGPLGGVVGSRIRASVADNLRVLKDLLEADAGPREEWPPEPPIG